MISRPFSVLIAALGGEGGGVLADWIVTAASARGHAVQASSIPGVAQRTGATTYYVEMSRSPGKMAPGTLTLAPAPGQVDVVVASELLEAGRAMLGGFVSPEATTLIASTHRIYTVAEKMQMGDGRLDDARIHAAAEQLAHRVVLRDFQALARDAGTVINAVLFGALAGSGALPLDRAACEDAIRGAGKGVEPSLRGFAAGYETASQPERAGAASPAPLPRDVADIVARGRERARDFQDERYARLYDERVNRIRALDAGDHRLTRETARFLALWMSYEDIVRVADLKSRRSRLARVRDDVRAKAHEPVHIVEYFKPRAEEIAALLPAPFAAWVERHGPREGFGLHLKTTALGPFLLLRALAALRPLRRMGSRYAAEQALIERWLAAIGRAAPADPALALEIALCGRLIKGYGDTHARGQGNFRRILDTLVEPGRATADAVRMAREAALADAGGRALDDALATQGIAPRPLRAQPLTFVRRPTEKAA